MIHAHAERLPVIIGVGQINDRETLPPRALDSLGLMRAALQNAEADAGGAWLRRLDSLAVVKHVAFPEPGDSAATLAGMLGASPRSFHTTLAPSGDSPILLLSEAAAAIAAGRLQVAAVAGGEALRSWVAQGAPGAGLATPPVGRNLAERHGLVAPVDIYPLYENAGRAAYGQSLQAGQIESSEIWSNFSKVAVDSDGAWLRKYLTPEEIRTPGPGNRMIAFPYPKLMVANSAVNQGAAFILTSLAVARAQGVPEHRLIYVGRGAAAREPDDIMARDNYARSASMAASLRQALAMNGLGVNDMNLIEIYSCFPCVPKMAMRALGWPVEKPASVFGGLTFGGGPIGNYMSHSIAAMVARLRISGGHGLLFGNGGFATSNHSIVVSTTPLREATTRPRNDDVQSVADALRRPVPQLMEDYFGPGAVETYSVPFRRDGTARFGVVVAQAPHGARFLARIPGGDTAGLAVLTDGAVEPVGLPGHAVVGADGIAEWRWS